MCCICISQSEINQQALEPSSPFKQVIDAASLHFYLCFRAKHLTVNVLQSKTHKTKKQQITPEKKNN